MGRTPCCDKTKVKRGPWSPEEDTTLKNFLQKYGTRGNWISLPQKAGLKRCGKSCRLRWLNYLRPDIKHGDFTDEEDATILTLYHSIGSRWSIIASHLMGRTDNDVKNYWNTKLKKKYFSSANYTTATSINTGHVTATNINVTSNNLLHEAIYYSERYNNSINSRLDTVAPPTQLPGLVEFPGNSELNVYNSNFPLRFRENVSSFSESSTSIDNTASSSYVMDLGSELMSFDHLLSAFDFQETNQSLVFSPYSNLEQDDAHLLYYNNYCRSSDAQHGL